MSITSPRRRALAAGLLVLSLAVVPVLTSCGSSSKASSSTDSSTTTLPDAHTTKLADVKVSGDFGTEPKVEFAPAFIGDTEENVVLIAGTGHEIKGGQRITANYVAINGNDGSVLDSTYTAQPLNLILNQDSLLTPVYNAIVGQKVGSRILVSANVVEANGSWILFVFDITAAIDVPTTASGTAVTPPAGLPVVTVVDGIPTIEKPVGDAPTTLVSQVLIKGDGPVITAGQTVTLQYTGIIWATGETFDSSWKSGAVDFPIGSGATIAGFDTGLVGQTIGSRVLLIIPPDQGYGSDGYPQAGISGTDTLVFVVDLLLAN